MKARPEASEHWSRRPSLRALLLAPAVAPAGCAPFSVGTMHEPGFAPASGVTYAWREGSEVITEFHADTGWDEPVGTIEYTASTLLVDLVTATGDTVVWRGWATGELAESSSAWVEDRIREAVEKMFEGFLVRPPLSPPMR